MRVGLMYELAHPEEGRRDPTAVYRQAIEEAVWSEQLGTDAVFIPEHHSPMGTARRH